MAKKHSRTKIGLVCTVCSRLNYVTEKSKITTPEPLKLNKYCKKCKKVTAHKEEKDLD
ncbi:hypothetical protein BH09PAT1_BH09PAT1_0800 [soil metagenome]